MNFVRNAVYSKHDVLRTRRLTCAHPLVVTEKGIFRRIPSVSSVTSHDSRCSMAIHQQPSTIKRKRFDQHIWPLVKMVLVLTIPLGTLLFVAVVSLQQRVSDKNELKELELQTYFIVNVSNLAKWLSAEKRVACKFLCCSDEPNFTLLDEIHERVDEEIQNFKKLFVKGNVAAEIFQEDYFGNHHEFWDTIINSSNCIEDVIDHSSHIIDAFVTWGKREVHTAQGKTKFWRKIVSAFLIIKSHRALGINGALGYCYFTRRGLKEELAIRFIDASVEIDLMRRQSFKYEPSYKDEYDKNLKVASQLAHKDMAGAVEEMTRIIKNNETFENDTEKAERWSESSTILMQVNADLIEFIGKNKMETVIKLIKQNNVILILYVVFASVVSVTCIILSSYYLYQTFRIIATVRNVASKVEAKRALVEMEKNRSDHLLNQMLPPSIIRHLQTGVKHIAESFDSVTVSFSDIEGFAVIASFLKPIGVVAFLNNVYSAFDTCVGQFDVYKVETVADTYMVASGVPERNGNQHIVEIATLSLALLHLADELIIPYTDATCLKPQLPLRIGIHTGPCVAGVVGLKTPQYCLFGDTINTASRMRSTGTAFRIHISQEFADELRDCKGFTVIPRGLIHVKGKGNMRTYWLVSGPSQHSPDSLRPSSA